MRRIHTLAREEGRILITEDKDFGELVFLQRLPHPSIVRLSGMTAVERADAVRILIESHGDELRQGAIIVITGNRVRIRLAANTE